MRQIPWKKLIETFIIGAAGGAAFYALNFPLPWLLGSLLFVMLWQTLTKRSMYSPSPLKNTGFLIMGGFFGLYFSLETLLRTTSYLLPYLFLSLFLIVISIGMSILFAKWITIDSKTSILSTLPGGLNTMVISSDSIGAKTSLVTIFQTIRRLAVLFIVPFLIVHFFTDSEADTDDREMPAPDFDGEGSYFWYAIPVAAAIMVRKKGPLKFLAFPLLCIFLMNAGGVPFPPLHQSLLIAAQVMVGTSLGKNTNLDHLKAGGKYGIFYFTASLILIAVSFGLGYILTLFTDLSLSTALISMSPGGIVEMILLAEDIDADPPAVITLQLTRIIFIILLVVPLLKWYFNRRAPFS
ncbi:AbrB family transcriptional regulator [Thalassobacillus sp. C254]|uniref:AbrB family transcriptional regulator n=1 Tax=Thalassobacillus sp. C254 TaxID=1225341 RepID=UPI0006D23297|nr:AbrB family transcriptional regulator [Thalassobacillus sp. C254]